MSSNTGYGDWRQARGIGIGTLDTRQTFLVVGPLLAPMLLTAFVGLMPAFISLFPALMVATLGVSRRGGVLVLDLMVARTRWRLAEWRGETSYRGQILAEVPRAWDLPGVLAPVTLLDVDVPGRGSVGVAWNQATGRMSGTLLLSPAGALLTDMATINQQVSGWGHLLASLADDETITHASVTVDLVPASGSGLADHIAERMDPGAPELAREVLGKLVESAPRGTSRSSARLTLTVDPSRSGRRTRSAIDAAAELSRTLLGLPISAAGADVLRAATPTDLVRIVRTAFDPAAQSSTAAQWEELDWADAGPVAAEDNYDHYLHDTAASVSWVMLAAPRQRVAHDVLFPLCKPGRYGRRVTLTYRALSREEAGTILERESNVASAREYARKKSKRDPTARENADRDRASRAATQEARGAGLVQFSLQVTATVKDPAQLPDARREVERAAGDAKLKLRLALGGQAAAFAAGLPTGIYPSDG